MFIVGLGTAVPPNSFTQTDCWDALQRADRPELTARTRSILQGILTHDNGIERRSLALDNLDNGLGVLVSACLFGDGAGAAVLSRRPRDGAPSIEWKAAASLHNPAQRDALRFEQVGGMLRNILTLPVPKLAGQHARRVLDDVLGKEGMTRAAIDAWILHAGGRKVLEELQRSIGLSPEEISWSSAVLREFGNLSSPFVFFVLKAALEGGARPGWWWLSSFGAGFSCHGALLRVA